MTDAPSPDRRAADPGEAWLAALERRRSIDPDFLGEPGPTPDQTARLLKIAARVPDHGTMEPWRFILLSGSARETASGRIAAAYREALATDMADFARERPEKAERQLEKLPRVFSRAPLVVVVVSRADPAARHPEIEQKLSAGAVCQNLIVAATAMGFGADWLTGWPAYDVRAHAILGLAAQESVAGFVHIGTILRSAPERRRPDMAAITTSWVG
ncbi:MAG: nitroreductase [Acetobacteraceae bacterium]|nr:nitroreductase [Acetobacteraceae bacterium]